MKKYRYLPVLFLLFFLPPITAAATTYYIDSGTGNDGNSGTSESLPWRSFTNVNNRTLAAGDRILLKSGAVWAGQQLAPRGSGTQSAPIIIDSYGGDARPVIDGNGMSSTTETWTEAMILLRNVQYWEISNIEITNAYSVQTRSTGIWVRNDAGGVLNHFVIRNCYIHHFTNGGTSTVNDSGDIHDKHQGGIYFYGTSGNGARFNDILIEGNELAYPGRTGISIRTESAYYWSQEADCITNVVIRNNAVSYTAGDGIVVLGIKGALLEHNVVHHCATANGVRTDASASMWGGWIQIDSVYQYNEVYAHQPGGDGTAFDYDIQCRDVVHQYNYTHDNYNGMMLVCGDFQGALTIRYNISLNENIVTDVGNNSNINLWWYNNTFYKQSGSHYLKGDYVYNNILYGSANHTIEAGSHDYNNMYPGGPGESHAVFSNPQFVSPGQVPTGRLNVTGYKLQPGSPNINAGMVITNNGGYDYWGTALSDGRPDIGFTEYTTNTATNTPVSGSTATPTPASNGAMIPGTIEAENYTAMSGIQTESCSEGGLNVGWIEAGDWMDYTVQINTEGTYSVSYRVASLSAGGQLQLQIGSTTYHTVSFGATGGWQTWTTVNGTATLPSGNQTIRIYASQTGWNINYMTFALNSSTSTPTMVLTTAPTVTPTRTPTPAATGTPQATATATPTPTNAAGLTDITDLAGT
ncbi:MAG: carbohydrate-binding protein, partial [Spirochaetales bacterium]|nr:carbohydrate-binding protein [Spirochaetales bacterium]